MLEKSGMLLAGIILAGGMLCHGYAAPGEGRAWAWLGCALLGAFSAAGWMRGWWSRSALGPARWFVALMVAALLYGILLLIPIPSHLAARISPASEAILESFRAGGLRPPASIPLALSPEQGWEAWNELAACAMFFSGVALLACRRRHAVQLLALIGALSVIEGWLGLISFAFGSGERASGAIFNVNHHAAAVLMGIPAALVSLARWRRRRTSHDLAAGLADSWLVIYGAVAAAAIGALVSFSRGALIMGMGVIAGWAACEIIGEHQALRAQRAEPKSGQASRRLSRRFLEGILLAGGFLTLVIFSTLVEGFAGRFGEQEGLSSRLELARASLRGLAETNFLGLGLAGTEYAINRFAVWPTVTNAIWAHNDYAQFIAEFGIPGTLLACVILVGFFRSFWRQWVRRASLRSWRRRIEARAVIAGLLAALGQAFTDFHLRIPLIAFMFLALLALLLAPGLLKSRQPEIA